ncbi:MAG TPA: penicillin-binding transpeptidase domain-containing protein [Planctomycetota bacterium]|nr:penicillin-binding transpeptidase domain-containing protein [Planctomycetota bacterium]
MFKTRIGILSLLFGLCFLAVIGRLFQLQVLRFDQYRALSARDSNDRRIQAAARADIVDRDGNVLAEDRPFFDIAVRVDRLNLRAVTLDEIKKDRELSLTPEQRKAHVDGFIQRLTSDPFVVNLATTLKVDRADIARSVFVALDNVARKPPWAAESAAQTIAQGVDEDTWLSLRSVHEDGFRNAALIFGKDSQKVKDVAEPPFPGLVCTVSTRRVYPRGAFACFVLGCVNDLNEQDEDQLRQYGVLLESPALRAAAWVKTREALNKSPAQAAQLADIFHEDPLQIDDIGRLYDLMSRLSPQERDAAARLGLADQIKWTQRPPRVKLNEPELLWLGVGLPTSAVHLSLLNRTIGESGAERYYNDFLRGKHTLKFSDASIANLALPSNLQNDAEPREGKPLRLTISSAWQEAAEKALQDQPNRGAIIVLDARSGEVLAMTSNPGFDPNVFTPPRNGPKRQEEILALLNNPDKPLLNRAIAGEYPLGSIMKTIVAAAALERGQLTPDETFECPGYIKEGGQIFHCDGNHAHGTVNVYKGLRCSCNVMFHQVGARVGVENLGPYAKLFLGKRTGIDLPFERGGVYPDRAWRIATFPNNPQARVWTRGNDFQLAIGQGQMSSTVLQAAVIMAAMANGGNVVTPRISLDGEAAPPVPLGVSERNLNIVRRGLDECVNVGTPGERGTAYTAFHANGTLAVHVAGKTSTAEHKKGAQPHAWFAGYLPNEKRPIAFAVMLEEAGHGGAVAAPIAVKMLKEIYGTK